MVMSFLICLTFLLIGLSGSTPTVSLSTQPHAIYGENLTLTCLVDKDVGLGYVQFRRDGSNILRITDICTSLKESSQDTYTYSVTCNLPHRIFTMVRQRVNYNDHNTTWSCQMYSASGSNGTCVGTSNVCNSAPVRVSVEGPPFVHLSPDSSEYNVTEGTKNFNFTCVVTQAIPWPTPNSFTWLYQASVIQGQRSLSYIIPEVQRSNDGYYQCIATNQYGNGTSKKFNLDVQYAAIVSFVDSKEIEEGDTIRVTCDVSANPKPVIVWTKSSKNVSVSSNLTIPSINRSQEGDYTCTANNLLYPTGQSPVSKTASKTLKVTVVYGPGNTINLRPYHSVYEVAINQRAADVMCKASCKPKCSYKWNKNGKTINNTNTLSLGVVQRSSQGNYTCEAYNTILHNTTRRSRVSVYVRVKYAPVVKVNSSCNAELLVVKLGQRNVVLSCVVIEAYPQPSSFIWTHNGTELQRDKRSNYTITEVTRETNGTWGCTGYNTYGKPVEDYMDIEVQYGPIVNISENKTLNEGESLKTECIVDANPPAFNVFWSKDDDSTFYRNTTELKFNRVSRYYSGTDRCTAVNQIQTSGQIEELLNGSQWFHLVVKFEDASLVGPVVGGVLAAIVVLTLLTITVFILKRRGCSHGYFIKPDAVSKQRENTGDDVKTHFPLSTIYQSLPRVGADPIYANAIDDGVARGGEYDGLLVNRPKSSLYLQLTVVSDITADISGNANDRQSVGDEYDDLNVYINYQVQSDISQRPEIQTEGEYQLYANLKTTT